MYRIKFYSINYFSSLYHSLHSLFSPICFVQHLNVLDCKYVKKTESEYKISLYIKL